MSTNTRDRIDTVAKRIEILEAEGNTALSNAYKLSSLHGKYQADVILEERLLAGVWQYVYDKHCFRLRADGGLDSYPKLGELLRLKQSHEKFDFWEAGSLRFDDGLMTLWLPLDTAAQFVKDHGIVVDVTEITTSRDRVVKQLEEMDALLVNLARGK